MNVRTIAIIVMFSASLLTGCGAAVVSNNASTAVPSPSANIAIMPKPANTATPAAGEKVVRSQTVKFASGEPPAGWMWIDPDADGLTRHEFKDGKLSLTVPNSKDLYAGNQTAPRLVKAVDGDFQIEAHVRFDPQEDYQGAGLLIFADAGNYIRLERCFGGLEGGGSGIRVDVSEDSKYTPVNTPIDIPTSSATVELKITRRLNVFSVFWREDDEGEWRLIDDLSTNFPPTIFAGVSASNTASSINAEFSSIRLSPQPVTRPH